MLESKRFQNIENGEIVNVMDEAGMFYRLSNGNSIKKDVFFLKFSEVVDASAFFNNAPSLSDLASQITRIDPSKVSNLDTPPVIIDRSQDNYIAQQTPMVSKEDMIRKYNETQAKKDLSQYKVYEDEDDAADDFLRKVQSPPPQQRSRPQEPYRDQFGQIVDPPINQGVSNPSEEFQGQQIEYPGSIQQREPIRDGQYLAEQESFKFFKSFKRIYPIKLTIDFDERIAEPNFIKMMSMNFEGDIIKYYTKEIMNRVYNDPGFLENKIYDKLRVLIMGEEKIKKPRGKKVVAPPPPPKKTRTPRVKKEDKENG